MDRAAKKYAHTSLPDSLLWKRGSMESRLVQLCPRKVRTRLFDHGRRPRHARRGFRDVSPLPVTKSWVTPPRILFWTRWEPCCQWQDYASNPAKLWVK